MKESINDLLYSPSSGLEETIEELVDNWLRENDIKPTNDLYLIFMDTLPDLCWEIVDKCISIIEN